MRLYVSTEEFLSSSGGGIIAEGDIFKSLTDAQLDVDALTFSRISAKGFHSLSRAQQELVRQAICAQAVFRSEYGEMLDSPLSSYGINGVNMGFDTGSRLITQNGVKTLPRIYAILQRSGLTYRGIR